MKKPQKSLLSFLQIHLTEIGLIFKTTTYIKQQIYCTFLALSKTTEL